MLEQVLTAWIFEWQIGHNLSDPPAAAVAIVPQPITKRSIRRICHAAWINIAEGKAQEINSLAKATAFSIQRVSEALSKPGGSEALKIKLVEQFIEEFGNIISTSNVTVVPAQLANIKGFFEGIGKVTTELRK